MPIPLLYICVGLLVVAVLPLPYGYYTLLRIVACGVFAYGAFVAVERNRKWLPYVYGVIAILFNPLVKVNLPKEVWAAVDIAAAALLVVTAKAIKAEA